MSLREDRFRHLLLLSVLLGVMVGVFGAAFAALWHLMDEWVWGHLARPADRIWVSGLVGLVIGLIMHRLGDPGNMSTIIRHFHESGRLPHRDNAPIVPVSLLGLVGGQSAGPEGVLTQVCGSMGTWLAERFNQPGFMRLLTLAGMGAGFGAFLRAPVGGALLWLEMLHERGLEYYEAVIPTLLCSFVGFLVMSGVLGTDILPVWHVELFHGHSLWHMGAAVGLGLAGTAAAGVYALIFRGVGRSFGHWRVPIYVRTAFAGVVIGLLGYFVPVSYFYGGQQMNQVLAEPMPLWLILAALLAKMLAASFTIRGHWQGGLIIPHLMMGALVGKAAATLLPELDPSLAMLCGMAGFNAAATKTPLSSALIVLALTGFGLPIPVFLASLTGFLAGGRVRLIEHKRPRTEAAGFYLAEPAGGEVRETLSSAT